MSFQQSGLGTNDYTYSNYFDRNGGWANYLNALSLQNNHDRQKVFGQANVDLGMVEIDSVGHPVTASDGRAGLPLPKKRVKYQKAIIAVPSKEKEMQALKKRGTNPKYDFGAPGSGP